TTCRSRRCTSIAMPTTMRGMPRPAPPTGTRPRAATRGSRFAARSKKIRSQAAGAAARCNRSPLTQPANARCGKHDYVTHCHPEPPKDGEGSQNAQDSAETNGDSTQHGKLEILRRPSAAQDDNFRAM